MKFRLFTLLVLLGLGTTVFAHEIPKGVEAVIVTTTQPDSLLFETTVSTLEAQGFTVNKSDQKRGTITTDHKTTSGVVSMRVLADVHSGVVTLKGQWSGSLMSYSVTNEKVVNKSGNIKKSFMQLNEIGEKIKNTAGGGTITYQQPTKN